jgi:hypothetical protein
VQFIVLALEMLDPVQCRLEISGMLDFGMPKVGVVDLGSDPMSACISPVRVEVRGAVTIESGRGRASLGHGRAGVGV